MNREVAVQRKKVERPEAMAGILAVFLANNPIFKESGNGNVLPVKIGAKDLYKGDFDKTVERWVEGGMDLAGKKERYVDESTKMFSQAFLGIENGAREEKLCPELARAGLSHFRVGGRVYEMVQYLHTEPIPGKLIFAEVALKPVGGDVRAVGNSSFLVAMAKNVYESCTSTVVGVKVSMSDVPKPRVQTDAEKFREYKRLHPEILMYPDPPLGAVLDKNGRISRDQAEGIKKQLNACLEGLTALSNGVKFSRLVSGGESLSVVGRTQYNTRSESKDELVAVRHGKKTRYSEKRVSTETITRDELTKETERVAKVKVEDSVLLLINEGLSLDDRIPVSQDKNMSVREILKERLTEIEKIGAMAVNKVTEEVGKQIERQIKQLKKMGVAGPELEMAKGQLYLAGAFWPLVMRQHVRNTYLGPINAALGQ
ncbi:hypothetical protein KKD37_01215 [Patescibacteria group bacterium]|nr:hypothetical protein [Patescibacteria group bacterium]